nr:unnamed protein product [Spirometra erinaceieuropaei]
MDFQSASISDIEKEFTIGFAIAVFKDINQVARLLRIIYRPQNFYVFHVDRKSSDEFYQAVVEVQKCFGENVHVVPREESVNVRWFTFTVLELELISARKLLQMGQWKYFINLTGQELPLRTNLELVSALRALNGSNLVEGTVRYRNQRRVPKVELSFPVTWVKGGVHAALKREFVEFMLYDSKAIEIRKALETHAYYKCPDEQFFATLVYNPQLGAPGACLHVHEPDDDGVDVSRLHHLIRYKKWFDEEKPTLEAVFFTEAIVRNELLNLKESTSPGPDAIPAKLLKELAPEMSKPLALIFQTSFLTGCLPSDWKTATITPLFKSGSRASANNYRPVSLTYICCKIMEKIIKKALMQFLEQHHLLSDA